MDINMITQQLFNDYATVGGNIGIEGAKFLKFCKDSKIFDALFRQEDVDVIFAKFKEPGQRYVTFKGFTMAISNIASKKGITTSELIERIVQASPSARRPRTPVTVPQATRFHDDSATYTGVHKVGGPSTIDREKLGLGEMLDRDRVPISREIRNGMGAPNQAFILQGENYDAPTDITAPSQPLPQQQGSLTSPITRPPPKILGHTTPPTVSVNTRIKAIFEEYCTKASSSGAMAIEGSKFLKFCKDASLFDLAFRQEDVDVVFAKFKEQGQRYMVYEGFTGALTQIAVKRGVPVKELIAGIIKSSPSAHRPTSGSVTVAQPTRFHDDASLYTGVHRAGGPSVVDREKLGLGEMLDRDRVPASRLDHTSGIQSPDVAGKRTSPQRRLGDAFDGPSAAAAGVGSMTPSQSDSSPSSTARGVRSDATAGASLVWSFAGSDSRGAGGGRATSSAGSMSSPKVTSPSSSSSSSSKKSMKSIFEDYCTKSSSSGAKAMEGSKFLKFCKDSSLFDAYFRQEDVDVLFAKCKEPGQRYITYKGFSAAIDLIATKKGLPLQTLTDIVLQAAPSAHRPTCGSVTVAQPTRFHDDASLYTGVHRAGGPSVVDREKLGLGDMLDRDRVPVSSIARLSIPEGGGFNPNFSPSATFSAGFPSSPSARLTVESPSSPGFNYISSTPSGSVSPPTISSPPSSGYNSAGSKASFFESRPDMLRAADGPTDSSYPGPPLRLSPSGAVKSTTPLTPPSPVLHPRMKPIFEDYCTKASSSGAMAMEGSKFLKFCKDSSLFDKNFHQEDVDVIFAKCKESGQRYISYKGFSAALSHVAMRKGLVIEDLVAGVLRASPNSQRASGPVTVAQPTRFHDDASLYTGVHRAGGPSVVDREKLGLGEMLDRDRVPVSR